MALGVNQMYKNYYTVRLGSLTTNHQILSNRVLLYTNEVTDIAQKINFFESQKVLTLADPSGNKLAIGAKYFDLPADFDMNDSTTWGNDPKYTTPCQKQIFIYKKAANQAEYDTAQAAGNAETYNGQQYVKVPYDKDGSGNYTNTNISDSRVLSNKLMTGEYTFVYRDDTGQNQKLSYKDLTFVMESEDKTAYQEQIQNLNAQSDSIHKTEKNIQQELATTETEIQAIQSMMDSTDKVLTKNTETFKWGA